MCTVRCPRGVSPTEIFHVLEYLAEKNGYRARGTTTPAMYRSFVNSIRVNGRVHEFGMMVRYYLSTNPFSALKLLPIAYQLLSHKRMPLFSRKIKGRDDLSKMAQKFREVRGG